MKTEGALERFLETMVVRVYTMSRNPPLTGAYQQLRAAVEEIFCVGSGRMRAQIIDLRRHMVYDDDASAEEVEEAIRNLPVVESSRAPEGSN